MGCAESKVEKAESIRDALSLKDHNSENSPDRKLYQLKEVVEGSTNTIGTQSTEPITDKVNGISFKEADQLLNHALDSPPTQRSTISITSAKSKNSKRSSQASAVSNHSERSIDSPSTTELPGAIEPENTNILEKKEIDKKDDLPQGEPQQDEPKQDELPTKFDNDELILKINELQNVRAQDIEKKVSNPSVVNHIENIDDIVSAPVVSNETPRKNSSTHFDGMPLASFPDLKEISSEDQEQHTIDVNKSQGQRLSSEVPPSAKSAAISISDLLDDPDLASSGGLSSSQMSKAQSNLEDVSEEGTRSPSPTPMPEGNDEDKVSIQGESQINSVENSSLNNEVKLEEEKLSGDSQSIQSTPSNEEKSLETKNLGEDENVLNENISIKSDKLINGKEISDNKADEECSSNCSKDPEQDKASPVSHTPTNLNNEDVMKFTKTNDIAVKETDSPQNENNNNLGIPHEIKSEKDLFKNGDDQNQEMLTISKVDVHHRMDSRASNRTEHELTQSLNESVKSIKSPIPRSLSAKQAFTRDQNDEDEDSIHSNERYVISTKEYIPTSAKREDIIVQSQEINSKIESDETINMKNRSISLTSSVHENESDTQDKASEKSVSFSIESQKEDKETGDDKTDVEKEVKKVLESKSESEINLLNRLKSIQNEEHKDTKSITPTPMPVNNDDSESESEENTTDANENTETSAPSENSATSEPVTETSTQAAPISPVSIKSDISKEISISGSASNDNVSNSNTPIESGSIHENLVIDSISDEENKTEAERGDTKSISSTPIPINNNDSNNEETPQDDNESIGNSPASLHKTPSPTSDIKSTDGDADNKTNDDNSLESKIKPDNTDDQLTSENTPELDDTAENFTSPINTSDQSDKPEETLTIESIPQGDDTKESRSPSPTPMPEGSDDSDTEDKDTEDNEQIITENNEENIINDSERIISDAKNTTDENNEDNNNHEKININEQSVETNDSGNSNEQSNTTDSTDEDARNESPDIIIENKEIIQIDDKNSPRSPNSSDDEDSKSINTVISNKIEDNVNIIEQSSIKDKPDLDTMSHVGSLISVEGDASRFF